MAFTPSASRAAYIKSIVVTFNKGHLSLQFLLLREQHFIIVTGRLLFLKVLLHVPIRLKVMSSLEVGNIKKGDVLPKATAVVLEAKEGKYIFEETSKAGETDPYNALRGSDTKTTTSGGEVYYVFGKGSNGVGFYWKKQMEKPLRPKHIKPILFIPHQRLRTQRVSLALM